ncbi:hypothetical protein ACFX1S_025558 [Malus domestica]
MEDPSTEMEIGTSPESFGKFLDSQRELFHSQINQLQRIVGTQCKLTGVNPLSQEMAAGALSIKIDGPIAGKRPRDLLNPKAIKYMQYVFSIKDAISKKESRELNALFGITVTHRAKCSHTQSQMYEPHPVVHRRSKDMGDMSFPLREHMGDTAKARNKGSRP